MAMNLYRMDLSRTAVRTEAEAFLKENGLRPEPLDTAFGLRDAAGRLIGFGGRAGDVLKCFAFDDAYRGQALLDPVITELITDAFHAGIEDLLVYTKARYGELFTNFGFSFVADTDTVHLLHRGRHTPEKAMDALQIDIPADKSVGAVVMNANPFTKGHRALVQHAATRVDRLIVFVVEHDASFYPFADRIRLVREGLEDLSNVIVVPSTRYMISAATFPSYFLKEKEQGQQEHAKLDAAVFLRWFVPRFRIEWRFVGEEPSDRTTAGYNQALLEILPPACSVRVIPRKRENDAVISASTVRAAIREGNWLLVRSMVPESTYAYLRRRHV